LAAEHQRQAPRPPGRLARGLRWIAIVIKRPPTTLISVSSLGRRAPSGDKRLPSIFIIKVGTYHFHAPAPQCRRQQQPAALADGDHAATCA
jgi:hypothetical protein